LRQLRCERPDDLLGRPPQAVLGTRLVDESMLAMNLFDQNVQSRIETVSDEEPQGIVTMVESTGMARKQCSVNIVDGLSKPDGTWQRGSAFVSRKHTFASGACCLQLRYDSFNVPWSGWVPMRPS
jgi:hypothetical protein